LRSSNSDRDARPLHPALGALLAGIAAFCLIDSAYAIDPNRAMSQYVSDHWGTEQGFPKGPLYAIAQTRDGYLWIGTESGLIRFDGWSFRLMQDPTGVLPTTPVLGLTSTSDGSLWILLAGQILMRYRDGVFERPKLEEGPYTNISAISQSSQGELLVSKMEDGTFDLHDGKFRRLATADELPRSPVISLAQTTNGEVWMGTRDAGLFRLSGGQTLPVRKGLPDLKVDCLLREGDQDLWVGTDNGIVRWNGSQLMAASTTALRNHFQALAMASDRDGNIWVGTDSQGLLRINSQGAAALQKNDGVTHEAVTAVFEDREGNLWIGGSDGVERLRDSAFVSYSRPEGLATDGSDPVFVDSQNRMWFPPAGGGLWWVKGEQRGRISNDGLDRDVVYSISGKAGELWIGRQSGGLTRVSDEHNSFIAKTYTQADGLAQNSVYSVYLARDGSVWAGTLSAGVSVLRNGRFTNYTIANGLASNTVVSILEGSDGTMWFATPNGLSALSNGHWRTYTTSDGLSSENVNCLLEDSTGVLWVGTAAGLSFRAQGRFHVPVSAPAVLRTQIFGVAEDRHGSLWMAASSHVLRVNREKLLNGTLDQGDLREYGLADGLRGLEGVKRHRSVVADSTGRIWFSLNRGISVVDPARLTGTSAPSIVHVQTISADGDPIRIDSAIQIPGGHRRITFSYTGLSFSAPDNVRYRYRLDGYDSAWSDITASREAGYTNLPPRHYRFRVIATNPDGVWSANEGALVFEVEPLFWQTWWFRSAVVLVCIAGILAIYRIRLHQATGRIYLRSQERLAERTRIAQELHDTLLQGFLSASMQVHVATDRLPDDSSVKPTLTRALELMRQVIDEGRNAVRGLRASQSASLDLEHAFSQIQQELVTGQQVGEDVDFRVIVDGERRPLHPVLRDEVYRIGREALINAFRHARAKKIELELKYSSKGLSVLVRDDGCGIDHSVLQTGRDGHWGLSGMRERADRIGARLHVMTSSSAGTEVELSVPSQLAFQDQSVGGLKWFANRRRSNKGAD
jgi:signal transduction histidine kinase/ligand-binding sensor domain-containing protein